jgi:hypothetical protein
MEHDVYICSWSQSDEGFELWVKSRPQIRAKGRTYDEAEKALIDIIWDHGGAMQAVMEFDPPLPKSEFQRKYSKPELCLVTGDESFAIDQPPYVPFEEDQPHLTGEALRQAFAKARKERGEREHAWWDGFFTAPLCRECRAPRGPRSEKPLTLAHSSSFDGGSVAFARASVTFARASIEIFSQAFLELLTAEERLRIEFRPVKRAKRTRKMFYELIGPSGPPYVVVVGLEFSGSVCEACGYRQFSYCKNGFWDFIAHSDLPSPLPGVFSIGTAPNLSLCVTAKRWAKMVGRPGTRGFISLSIGVVPDHEVVRNPEFKTFQERKLQEELRRKELH